MTDIVERLREGVFGSGETKTDTVIHAHMQVAADEIERLRAEVHTLSTTCGHCGDLERAWAGLEKIVAMRPPIPEDAEGNGPNWEQYIYTRTWALFAASLQDTARAVLGGER